MKNSETIVIKTKDNGVEIIATHDQTGSAYSIDFSKEAYEQLRLHFVSNRLSEMEEAGKEATSLIAHLKDQHGFNSEEQASQDKIMDVFEYEGRW